MRTTAPLPLEPSESLLEHAGTAKTAHSPTATVRMKWGLVILGLLMA